MDNNEKLEQLILDAKGITSFLEEETADKISNIVYLIENKASPRQDDLIILTVLSALRKSYQYGLSSDTIGLTSLINQYGDPNLKQLIISAFKASRIGMKIPSEPLKNYIKRVRQQYKPKEGKIVFKRK